MDLQQVWKMQGIFFLLVLIGFFLKRIKMIKSENKEVFTDLVLNVFLPATIVNSFQMKFETEMIKLFGILIGLSIIIIILCYILGVFLFSKYTHEQKNVLRFGTLISNAGFIGLPVAESFYGPIGLLYGAVFIIPLRMALWTVGLSLFLNEKDTIATLKKMVIHPCMIAVYIGSSMMISGIRFFEPINTTVIMLSKCTTPMVMIFVGSIIGEVDNLKTIFNWDVLRFSIIRVIIIPTIVYIFTLLSNLDPIIVGIAVILTSMPAGSATVILATKYDNDYVLGTKIVILSTILSMFAIPIWGIILFSIG
ncbi:hypothetical protein SAMN02745751_03717 [Dethiosulfatibacter aminovorans DSM 17477]|uniref:AEC family transporter n=1 Tax=Dethiosulfatibacter aminovorans DSM 17477 TaxID=1121476 RepID=A0A1M6N9H3_9FIRM|nr:AEC family transporter [Dethiosulfatibacter aminovorans]SHJ92378.1 hypothetical protein SAMN02745751_03717 [Dethiosulfatibacter aminovorans DSM 17477]